MSDMSTSSHKNFPAPVIVNCPPLDVGTFNLGSTHEEALRLNRSRLIDGVVKMLQKQIPESLEQIEHDNQGIRIYADCPKRLYSNWFKVYENGSKSSQPFYFYSSRFLSDRKFLEDVNKALDNAHCQFTVVHINNRERQNDKKIRVRITVIQG